MILHINIRTQTLSLNSTEHDQVFKTYKVSTSKFGVGEENNSFKTPRGTHCIRAKIGADEPIKIYKKSQRSTGGLLLQKIVSQYLLSIYVHQLIINIKTAMTTSNTLFIFTFALCGPESPRSAVNVSHIEIEYALFLLRERRIPNTTVKNNIIEKGIKLRDKNACI